MRSPSSAPLPHPAMIALATLVLATASPPAPQEGRPWTVDDPLALVGLSSVAMSPDGELVFFAERRIDWEANDSERTFWLIPASGGEPTHVDAIEGGSGFRFSPDGASLTFVGGEDDQVLALDVETLEVKTITSHAGGVDEHRWSPDGRRIFFVAEEQRGTAEQEAWDAGGDAVFVGEGANGLDAEMWSNLWVHDVASGEEERLTDERLSIGDFDVAPDGERVAFTGQSDNRTNYFWRSELYVVDRRNRFVLQLTDNDAPEDGPVWSPDGRRIAYHSPHAESFDLRNGYVWIVEPLTGERVMLEGQREGELRGLVWSADGERLLFAESRGTSVQMFEMDAATGEVRALTELEGTIRPRAFSADRTRMAYVYDDFTTPADLFVAGPDCADPVRLTRANPWVDDVAIAPGEIVRWKSRDGREVEGTLMLPPGYDGTAPLPLVMDIHGGPPGYWGNSFEPEHQVFAALGYALFAPNPRGSSSYGDEHLRALMGDVGGGEFDDLMTGIDHLVERGVADPDRLALRGWSWGGILGAWTIGHTKRFKAASLGAMVGDWAAETGGGLMFDLALHYIGGNHWEDSEEWHERSALTYVAQVDTPTLLLHGEDDGVSTVNQSQMFYTALREREIPVRFIKFPREGHGIDEPRHRRIAAVEEVRWIQRHVRGERWDPPVRGAVDEPPATGRYWLDPDAVLAPIDLDLVERMEEARVAGLSAALIKGGELVWTGAYGWADVEGIVPVRDETLFQLASVSKTVTVCAILQLVEEGELDLDADVDEVLGFSVRHPEHADVSITLRQLLTHTAAIRDNWLVLEGTWVRDGDVGFALRDSLEDYLVADGAYFSAERNFRRWAPGSRGRYSNVGIALAALVAETASGVPFEQLTRERVLDPLGIAGGFRLAEVDLAQVAVPHRWSPRDGFVAEGHHSYLDFPAGTLRLSAPGLARFLLAFARGGEVDGVRLLEAETVKEAMRVQFPDLDRNQGLVWYRSRQGGERMWGHDGGDPGVTTQMFFRPDDGSGYVLLMNGEPRGRGAEGAIVKRLLQHLGEL